MKYFDEETQTYKDISIKILDTLPVGAVIDYDGEIVPVGWEECGSSDYSTEETFTGEYYHDGKPIYKKCFKGSLANESILLTNVSSLVDYGGTAQISGTKRAIPYYEIYNNQSYIATIRLNTNGSVQTTFMSAGNYLSSQCDIWIKYTKTTD